MMLAMFGFFLAMIAFAFSALYFIFWLWMLIDAIKSPNHDTGQRIVWVLVIIFLPVLGPIIYLFAGKS